jgi:hypothetical protein
LLQQLARAFAERGERHLRQEDPVAAWNDLVRAEEAGAEEPAAVRLRQALNRLGVAEVRALLETGEPGRAVEAAAQLRDRAVHQPELELLEEAARGWEKARELAGRGEFAQAQQALVRVRRLMPRPLAALEKAAGELEEQGRRFTALVGQLHQAAQSKDWQEVLALAEQVLAAAPNHAEARKARTQAWKAVEPVTVVVPRPPRPAEPLVAGESAGRFLLWIDGVGGYLVCLGNRITLGQALPEAVVDVALFADVSRLHATLSRDSEGYLLEAARPVQVNGKYVERALLHPGDRVTLGRSCQLQFHQPVPVSASARLDLVSGHRLRPGVDGVLLMADTLVLGPGHQAHVPMPDLAQPVILFRGKDGLAVRHQGKLTIDGCACDERGTLGPASTVAGEDFALAVEPVGNDKVLP